MSKNVVNVVVARHQAEMMVLAGEFMMAVKTIYEDNQQALNNGEESRFNEQTMDGLIGGLEIVGRKLVTEGVGFIEDDNAIRQGV